MLKHTTSDEDPAGSADRSAKDGHCAFLCRGVSRPISDQLLPALEDESHWNVTLYIHMNPEVWP